MEDVPDENQHERDRIEIPGLDKDRGHHQPTNPVPFRVVVRDQIADGAIHRCLMDVGGQHAVSFLRAYFIDCRSTELPLPTCANKRYSPCDEHESLLLAHRVPACLTVPSQAYGESS